MTFGHQTAMQVCHTGGIVEVIDAPRGIADWIIRRLMTCTDHHGTHVFIVDQSKGDQVRIGMSVNGMACIQDLPLDLTDRVL